MEIALGKPVITSNGKHIGDVDHIVLDNETKAFVLFIVHQGIILTKDRMIEPQFVDKIDEDGTIHLNVDEDRVDELPEYVRDKFATATEDDLSLSPGSYSGAGGVGAPFLLTPAGWGQGYEDRALLIEEAPIDPPEVQVDTNMPPNASMIDRGSKVIDSKGDDIGSVEEVNYNDDGDLVSMVVRTGHLLHHDYEIPGSVVASVSDEHVHLTISGDEVENTKRSGSS